MARRSSKLTENQKAIIALGGALVVVYLLDRQEREKQQRQLNDALRAVQGR